MNLKSTTTYNPLLKFEEWKNSYGLGSKLSLLSVVCAIFLIVVDFLFLTESSSFTLTKQFQQWLILFNFAIGILLCSLILRRLVKLWVARRRGITGSKLHAKLVGYFSLIAVTPAIFVAFFAVAIFNLGLQSWFNEKVSNVVNNSLNVAEGYLNEHKNSIKSDILLMSYDLNRAYPLYVKNKTKFQEFFVTQSLIRSFSETYLINGLGEIVLEGPHNYLLDYKKIRPETLDEAKKGQLLTITEDDGGGKLYVVMRLDRFMDTFLYASRHLDQKVIGYFEETKKAVKDYTKLETERSEVEITFAIVYLVVVLLLLLTSGLMGLWLANRLVTPLGNLILAAERVSSGDYKSKVTILDNDDELDSLNKAFNKMTDRLASQKEQIIIAQRHAAWADIARRIAHEIKNPLTPIQLSAERLLIKYSKKESSGDDDFKKSIETIIHQVGSIRSMVDEFSDFARMPAPVIENAYLNDIIAESLEIQKIANPNIVYDVNMPDEKIMIKCDKNQILQVFMNLLKNSQESINDKIRNGNLKTNGLIQVNFYEKNSLKIVDIVDNGLGFPDSQLNDLLKPYVTNRKDGTGLGLAIVNKIMNDHNGKLVLNDRKDDEFSGASITLSFV